MDPTSNPGSAVSRRWVLGLPIGAAAASALAACSRRGGRSEWVASDADYFEAEESPTYDQRFAVFVESLSVASGDDLVLRARWQGRFDIAIHRVEWQLDGAPVAVRRKVEIPGDDFASPDTAAWPEAFRVTVPATWKSGLYVAVLTDPANPSRRRFAPFVVRATQPARVVVGIPFTTYHAYNGWGGASLYDFNSPSGVATVLPIRRPFDVFDGAGFLFYGDWQLARWLDRERYDVSYVTSYDLHRTPGLLDGARVFVSAFHDEYWSTPMRDELDRFIAAGGNAAFLGANSIYWRVRLDDEQMTCFKAKTVTDDPHPDITTRWRDAPIDHPESNVHGSLYESYQFPFGRGFDWTVTAEDHWLYERTGLANGAILPGLVGYEWDNVPRPIPDGVEVLSHSDFTDDFGDARSHEASVRVHPGGGTAINVGTTYWPRFLIGDRRFRHEPAVETMTHNMLRRLG